MTKTTRPSILDRLKVYEEFGPLSCLAIHPETPGYTTGMVLRDAREARAEIKRLRSVIRRINLQAMTETTGSVVKKFHIAFDIPTPSRPQFPPEARRLLRWTLDEEERKEALEADAANDLIAFAEEMADRAIVLFGQAWEHGIDLEAVIAEKMRANMSKLGADGKPILREDGKVLKGPNYRPADTASVLMSAVEVRDV
jgi:predicted HAD superfamily Cof-like phosphohydrolase